jgi:hypothetical protein
LLITHDVPLAFYFGGLGCFNADGVIRRIAVVLPSGVIFCHGSTGRLVNYRVSDGCRDAPPAGFSYKAQNLLALGLRDGAKENIAIVAFYTNVFCMYQCKLRVLIVYPQRICKHRR